MQVLVRCHLDTELLLKRMTCFLDFAGAVVCGHMLLEEGILEAQWALLGLFFFELGVGGVLHGPTEEGLLLLLCVFRRRFQAEVLR